MLNNFPNLNDLAFFRNLSSNAEQLKRNQQWNNTVDKFLSPSEQFFIGAKLATEQYKAILKKNRQDNPILVLRNPEQIANNIVRHAFKQLVKTEFIPGLYYKIQQMLMQTDRELIPYLPANYEPNAEQYTLSSAEHAKLEQESKAIMEYIKENIPIEIYSGLQECYGLHKLHKPELAEKDFINLIMFQFITSALVAYADKTLNRNNSSFALNDKRLIPLALKNIYTTGGTHVYNRQGQLQDILNAGFGNGQLKSTGFIIDNLDKKIQPLILDFDLVLSKLNQIFTQIENDQIQELMQSFGVLKLDVSLKQAFVSKDSKRLSQQFKKTMECYTANILDHETFKNIIETLIEKGCPSAIYFKGHALLGCTPTGFTSPYPVNYAQGLQELLRLKEGDEIFHHINVSEHSTYWKKEDIDHYTSLKDNLRKNEQMQQFLTKAYHNIYDLYANTTFTHKNKVKKNIILWGMQARNYVHSNISSIRSMQITLLQNIIDNTTIAPNKKIPLLLATIEAIRHQIGKTFVKSRLREIMDKLLQDLTKKSEKLYGIQVNEFTSQQKQEALYQYLKQVTLDEKFKQSLITHFASSNFTQPSLIKRLSQKL
ncbi:MAG TPA: hypothetical protein VFP93_02535 [Gammaproteobacteria bacterium]|nr:hypothetical protein [Gammaproteobacteria bacterium]